MALVLYHSDGCHLCEQAEALLAQAGVAFALQEIINDEQLLQRYRERIPVLAVVDADTRDAVHELGWPFDAEQLALFLNRYAV
jgi:glutaredoxin